MKFRIVLQDEDGRQISERRFEAKDDPEQMKSTSFKMMVWGEELWRDAVYTAGLWDAYSPLRRGDYWRPGSKEPID